VLAELPGTRTLIAMVFPMNRDDCRSPARSVANQEFHQTDEHANQAARGVTQALQDAGRHGAQSLPLLVLARNGADLDRLVGRRPGGPAPQPDRHPARRCMMPARTVRYRTEWWRLSGG
jgi:hypothetical protein